MSRFYFDFRQGNDFVPDSEGTELVSTDQAYLEAFEGAREMWSELLKQRQDPRRCRFEVRDAQGALLFVLPFLEVPDACPDCKPASSHGTFEQVSADRKTPG